MQRNEALTAVSNWVTAFPCALVPRFTPAPTIINGPAAKKTHLCQDVGLEEHVFLQEKLKVLERGMKDTSPRPHTEKVSRRRRSSWAMAASALLLVRAGACFVSSSAKWAGSSRCCQNFFLVSSAESLSHYLLG